MSGLLPVLQLNVAYDRQYYGQMTYCGDDLVWPLANQEGRPGISSSGFVTDPTGNYLIQQPVFVPTDASETNWTTSGGTFTHITNPTTLNTELFQVNGGLTVASGATFSEPHDDEEGFRLTMYRGSPVQTPGGQPVQMGPSDYFLYAYLNYGPIDGAAWLRVACEYGNLIHLDVSFDGVTWTIVDTATALGDSDSYLQSKNNQLVIDVYPFTDGGYYTGLPQSAQTSQPPPDQVVVVIGNGDAILTWQAPQASFRSGYISLEALGGQYTCGISWLQYAPYPEMVLPQLIRPRPFQTQPEGILNGYISFGSTWEVVPIVTDVNKAYAVLALRSPDQNIDPVTGNSGVTAILSSANLHFPQQFIGRQTSIGYASLNPCFARDTHQFYQTDFLRRSSAEVWLEDTRNIFAPGATTVLGPFVRAAQLVKGSINPSIGYDDTFAAITGLACINLIWEWVGKKKYLKIHITDRFRDVICGYMLPMDGQCHYYAIRQLAYRMGITDEWMGNFPYCIRDGDCPHYKLPRGTTPQPILQFPPNTKVLQAMLQIRSLAGEIDFSTNTVLPMYLFFDTGGYLQYLPAPVGLVQTWLDDSLNPITQGIELYKTYSAVPSFTNGYPDLNEIVLSANSEADLLNIRTHIVLEGIEPSSGGMVTGYFANPALGAGLAGNPNQFGYVGLDTPYYDISHLYSSPEAAYIATQVAAVQMSFPSISTGFTAQLQSQLFPLMAVGVRDYGTQGSTQAVNYYVTGITSTVSQLNPVFEARSVVQCRLLGQAG